MKIGLALSGGGFRATVFHLGVLARLAKENRLEDIRFLSTVSGGSLSAGLVYSQSGYGWPGSTHFLTSVLPAARLILTTEGLQSSLLRRFFTSPLGFLINRSDDLSQAMQDRWGITGNLAETGGTPRWIINATCYETGRSWRFEAFQMGDAVFGYSHDTSMPLSEALAASAAYPGLIGSLNLKTSEKTWFRYLDSSTEDSQPPDPGSLEAQNTEPIEPLFPKVHLWDGGVYDNLGLEPLHNFEGGWRDDLDFLISSDASGKLGIEDYRIGSRAFLRIVDIAMSQVRSLRLRAIMERMKLHGDLGSYLRIGRSCEEILRAAGKEGQIGSICPDSLNPEQARKAEKFPTTIQVLSAEDFELLFRHGFEVADTTLYGFHDDQFDYIGYVNL